VALIRRNVGQVVGADGVDRIMVDDGERSAVQDVRGIDGDAVGELDSVAGGVAAIGCDRSGGRARISVSGRRG